MKEPIIIAPTLADASTVVIYRSNGEEIVVNYKEKKTLASGKKTEY
jgi:hypothetical protein